MWFLETFLILILFADMELAETVKKDLLQTQNVDTQFYNYLDSVIRSETELPPDWSSMVHGTRQTCKQCLTMAMLYNIWRRCILHYHTTLSLSRAPIILEIRQGQNQRSKHFLWNFYFISNQRSSHPITGSVMTANKKWAEKWHISCQSYFCIQPSKTVLAS